MYYRHLATGDVMQQKPRLVLSGHRGMVWALAFSPDSKLLASGANDRTVRCWSTLTGEEVLVLTGHTQTIAKRGVCFSLDGRRLASIGLDGRVIVWDTVTGEALRQFQVCRRIGSAVAFAPVKELLAVAEGLDSETCRINIWRLSDGGLERGFSRNWKDVRALAFDPAGAKLAVGTDEDSISIWDVSKAVECGNLNGHLGGT